MTEQPNNTPTIPGPLGTYASAHPETPAVIGLKRTITWGELQDRSCNLAKNLFSMGLRPGDKAAVMSYNLPEVYEITQALGLLNVGVIMVGFQMQASEIEYIVGNSESRFLFFYRDFADRILPNKNRYANVPPEGFIQFDRDNGEEPADDRLFRENSDVDLFNLPPVMSGGEEMIYTSGTTGKPKGALRDYSKIDMEGAARLLFHTIDFLKYDANEVHLFCCPIYHSGPSYFGRVAFNLGGTIVLQQRFNAEEWFDLVARYRVTSSHIVPTMLYSLLEVPESLTDKLDLSSLRSLICGAAPMNPDAKLEALNRLGPVLYEYYGSTETAVNTMITPAEIPERPTSVGKAFGENDIVLVDEKGDEVPDGKPGIMYVHNAVCAAGYFKNEKASDEIKFGKYVTAGDIARRDEEGFYYIVDRIKDMIIRGGVNIYPAEIEQVLNSMPGIRDSAVLGKPDDHWGETVTAFIVADPAAGVKEDSVNEYCRKNLSRQKVPADILFVDEIPRTPTGKILKRELKNSL